MRGVRFVPLGAALLTAAAVTACGSSSPTSNTQPPVASTTASPAATTQIAPTMAGALPASGNVAGELTPTSRPISATCTIVNNNLTVWITNYGTKDVNLVLNVVVINTAGPNFTMTKVPHSALTGGPGDAAGFQPALPLPTGHYVTCDVTPAG